MSQFEFVMTGQSILIAIMVGRIISTLSMLRRQNIDYRHTGWLIVLSLHLLFFWWFGWRYSEVQFDVYGYFALLVPTLVLMFAISLFTPNEIPDDWPEYFEITRKKFFASYAIFG